MNIAIIGTGNVGGALATKWGFKGHQINLGVRDTTNFKGKALLKNLNTTVFPILEAVEKSEIILLATPAMMAVEVTKSLGKTSGKIIIDSMNIIRGNGPEGFSNTADAILANTATEDVVKCFNTTGFNNISDTKYGKYSVDMFMAGNSEKSKAIAQQLALDAGFEACYDIGGNDKFQLMEQFAWFWINLAMVQGEGREMAFKLLKR
ncbi:MAG: NAD(P)-binding domain-containing protein [Cyclobacteriaceae bacterium]